jgi:DNA-directed RNA polymerase subunit RPC12/RpoP
MILQHFSGEKVMKVYKDPKTHKPLKYLCPWPGCGAQFTKEISLAEMKKHASANIKCPNCGRDISQKSFF